MNEKLAYLAGLFDGEGSFSIQVSVRQYKGQPSILLNPKLTMTLRYGTEVLDELKDMFGGTIYIHSDNMTRWSLNRLFLIENATKLLLPYLRIKHKIAERFLEALALYPKRKFACKSWTKDNALKVAEIAITLNPERSRKSSKTLAYLEVIKQAYE